VQCYFVFVSQTEIQAHGLVHIKRGMGCVFAGSASRTGVGDAHGAGQLQNIRFPDQRIYIAFL